MTPESERKRAHVVISGRVQGVSFRYATLQMAQKCQVKGWVRNRGDGKVEAVFEGVCAQVESMVAWCGKGPPSANVDGVDIVWEPVANEFAGFNIRF